MKKRKIKKGRITSFVTLGLAAVSLVSVGFSAWIIRIETASSPVQINTTVADVENQTVGINIVANADSSLSFDAANGDGNGEIIASNTVVEDYTFGVSFNVVLDKSNTSIFNGISISTREILNSDYDSLESKSFYELAQYGEGQVINFPTVLSKADKLNTGTGKYEQILPAETVNEPIVMPLIAKDAITGLTLDDPEKMEKTIYLNKQNDNNTVFDVTALYEADTANYKDYNIVVGITLADNVATTEDLNDVVYTFNVTFTVAYGNAYKGLNPSLCDGAEEDSVYQNAGFSKQDDKFVLPAIDTIIQDLNDLNTINGNGLEHTLHHIPGSTGVTIEKKQPANP